MREPARLFRLCGEGEYRDQAEALIRHPGDAALVQRGVLRSVVMGCPDGCGDTLVVNLDPRAGKSWWLDRREGKTTLYPSVWRDSGCGSHFIVWRDRIVWCDRYQLGNDEPAYEPGLEARVLPLLSSVDWRRGAAIARELGEIPWEVSQAARALAKRGLVEEAAGDRRDWFRRRSIGP